MWKHGSWSWTLLIHESALYHLENEIAHNARDQKRSVLFGMMMREGGESIL